MRRTPLEQHAQPPLTLGHTQRQRGPTWRLRLLALPVAGQHHAVELVAQSARLRQVQSLARLLLALVPALQRRLPRALTVHCHAAQAPRPWPTGSGGGAHLSCPLMHI